MGRSTRHLGLLALLLAGCPYLSEEDLAARMDLDGDGAARPDDCDDDDAGVGTGLDWYLDGDGDGFGTVDSSTHACTPPPGYVDDATDCDDGDSAVFPGADEVCNGYDDDCDGGIDNAPSDPLTFYLDDDGDGHGDPEQSVEACAAPQGYVTSSDDCDDGDSAVSPSAEESCGDDIDNDCDGRVDLRDWYRDSDGDGFGDDTDYQEVCEQPVGYVPTPGDCDDDDPQISPGAIEHCDPFDIDEDCDGLAEDADDSVENTSVYYQDADGDGFGNADVSANYCDPPKGWESLASDCDDSDAAINPNADEIWYDGVDQDCDDWSDYDADGDGYDSEDFSGTDCDDDDFYTNPGAIEGCGDDIDNDCDGEILGDCALAGEVGLLQAEAMWWGEPYDRAGGSVAVDDWNGDGQVDLFVGATYRSITGSHSSDGGGYLLYGPITSDGELDDADVHIHGYIPSGFAGEQASAPGDLSGDGVVDLLIEAQNGPGGDRAIYLLTPPFGATVSLDDAHAMLELPSLVHSPAGDIDGDGQHDLLVKTHGWGASEQWAYVHYGPISGQLVEDDADLAIAGEGIISSNSLVLGDVDLNGDGLTDLVLGAPDKNVVQTCDGALYILYDPMNTTTISDADAMLYGEYEWSYIGLTFSSPGDTDGDGYDDLLTSRQHLFSDTGRAYLVRGPVSGSLSLADADAVFDAEAKGDYLGSSTAGAGDPNFDGLQDIAITAPAADSSSELSVGAAYILLSPQAGMVNVAEADGKLVGTDDPEHTGVSIVSTAGDISGDGYEDIFVGHTSWCPGDTFGTYPGGFFLFFGGPEK
jgi:hypothetical protein